MFQKRDQCLAALKVKNLDCYVAAPNMTIRFVLQGKSLQEMKMSIGEKLYYLIYADYPETAGKLTGMFLEATDSVEDLALLLFSPASLKLLMNQAFDVLSVSPGTLN